MTVHLDDGVEFLTPVGADKRLIHALNLENLEKSDFQEVVNIIYCHRDLSQSEVKGILIERCYDDITEEDVDKVLSWLMLLRVDL